MLKGRRKNKPVMQPIHDLSVDPMVEDVQRNQETLEEAIAENDQDLFDDDNLFSESENFDDFDFGRWYPTEEDLKQSDPSDPFSTSVKSVLLNSYIDRCERAHCRYIELAKNPFTADYMKARHELLALRHISAYWALVHEEMEGVR